jgi:flagellar protein FlgJ
MKIGAAGISPDVGTAGPISLTQKEERIPASRETAATKKVAKEFESLFIGMMLKSMRETIGKDKITDGGHGEEIYRSMLDQEYSKALTERGGIGLALMFEQQLAKSQGMSQYDKANQQIK